MNHSFNFSTFWANQGAVSVNHSKKVFETPKEESKYRDIAKRVFAGEPVLLPDAPFHVIGQVMDDSFIISFFQNGLSVLESGLKIPVIEVCGTVKSGSGVMLMIAGTVMDSVYRSCKQCPYPETILKQPAPDGPYAVVIRNCRLLSKCDQEFFLSGKADKYAYTLSCVALDMLLH